LGQDCNRNGSPRNEQSHHAQNDFPLFFHDSILLDLA
jgi:hypothetical protein